MKVFNLSNTTQNYRGKRRVEVINVGKSGQFSISETLATRLELKEGDRINILQSETDPMDIYISPTKDENGFPLKQRKKGLAFSCKEMSTMISKLLKIENKSFSLKVITKESIPVENNEAAYLLITTKPIIYKK